MLQQTPFFPPTDITSNRRAEYVLQLVFTKLPEAPQVGFTNKTITKALGTNSAAVSPYTGIE
jgi:hypothetical protein